jgi:hypothetical protein
MGEQCSRRCRGLLKLDRHPRAIPRNLRSNLDYITLHLRASLLIHSSNRCDISNQPCSLNNDENQQHLRSAHSSADVFPRSHPRLCPFRGGASRVRILPAILPSCECATRKTDHSPYAKLCSRLTLCLASKNANVILPSHLQLVPSKRTE